MREGKNDLSKVSQVSQLSDQERLQAYALPLAHVWHPSAFMQSLQLTLHRVRTSGYGGKV